MSDDERREVPDDYLTTKRGQEALAYQLDKLFGEKPSFDPIAAAIDVLKRELPGFEAGIAPATDAIRILWRMKLGAELGQEALFYVAPRDQRDVYMVIRPIIEQARAHAVRDFGLDAVMRERELDAFERGRRTGRTEGIAEGKRLGRLEVLRELQRARELEEEDDFGL